MAFVDTNLLLRWLLGDHPRLSAKAEKLVTSAAPGSLLITDIVLSEVWYVLRASGRTRPVVAEALWLLERTPAFRLENPELVTDYVRLLATTKLDFADCYLMARSRREKLGLETFDEALAKISG